MATLTPKLRKEYLDLFASCEIRPQRRGEAERIRTRIVSGAAVLLLSMSDAKIIELDRS